MIIGISGKTGSGKSTIARMIAYYTMDPELRYDIERNQAMRGPTGGRNAFITLSDTEFNQFQGQYIDAMDFTNVAFQNNVKAFLAKTTGGDPWSNNWRESILDSQWNVNGENITGGHLLNSFQHSIREHVHPEFWVNSLFKFYIPAVINADEGHPDIDGLFDLEIFPNWAITDVKYWNEVDAIKNWGKAEDELRHVIRVNCPGDKIKQIDHPSETDLDQVDFNWDFVFENMSNSIPNVETLWEAVRCYMESYPELEESITI